jgi:hypothetical protein
MPPRYQAGIVSRQAGSANVRPHIIDRARRRCSDLADERRTTIAIASHASEFVVDKRARNTVEIFVALKRESRPLPGIRATRTTSLAHIGSVVVLHVLRELCFYGGLTPLRMGGQV